MFKSLDATIKNKISCDNNVYVETTKIITEDTNGTKKINGTFRLVVEKCQFFNFPEDKGLNLDGLTFNYDNVLNIASITINLKPSLEQAEQQAQQLTKVLSALGKNSHDNGFHAKQRDFFNRQFKQFIQACIGSLEQKSNRELGHCADHSSNCAF